MGDVTRMERYRESVLLAPLWLPSAKWSSRSIADDLGISQSLVARIWRSGRSDSSACIRLATLNSSQPLKLLGLLVTRKGSCLVFCAGDTNLATLEPVVPASIRSIRRLRAVLAADVARQDISSSGSDHNTAFWKAVDETATHKCDLFAIISGDIIPPKHIETLGSCCDSRQWQGLLHTLQQLPERQNRYAYADLEHQLRNWYHAASRDNRSAFWWVDTSSSARQQSELSTSIPPRSDQPEGVTNAIISSIQAGLSSGEYSNGDKISDRQLSKSLGVTRNQVRTALHALSNDGLVTGITDRTVTVHLPTVDDVLEIYAARRALGAIAIRAASRTPSKLAAVKDRFLPDLQRCAQQYDITAAQKVDMALQEALFDASGLTRVSAMLTTLSKQTLMFIMVIGIRYTYSPKRIYDLDREILTAVQTGDDARAIRAWQYKIDEGAQYMIEQVNRLQL